jgi:hypothetical protein
MFPTSVVAAAGNPDSTPRGAHHQRLQLRWWPLPEIPTAPPRGPTIDILQLIVGPTYVFAASPEVGPVASVGTF